jgi:peptidoglycan hydrolase-like protein with peptidoglycan-binding domain
MPGTHSHGRGVAAGDTRRRFRTPLIILTVVVAIAAVAVVAVVVPKVDTSRAASDPTPAAKAANAADVSGPFTVVATSPANTATDVPSDATITVQLSSPVASGSPTPTLSPAVAGSWQLLTPTTFTFVATAPFVPSSSETVSVPATVASTDGKTLGTATSAEFTVAAGTTLRLQQLLATLDYLPLSFTPAGPLTAPQEAAVAQAGTFSWRWTEPASLTALWTEGTPNTITKGAVMAFESQHNLKTDGAAGPAVWTALLMAAGVGAMDPAPYNYVYVTQSRPETATVYSDGAEVYSTLANTGVAGAPTAEGTFPVYERFVSTTMTGTNPDGSKYSDPNIPWVSYFNGGDALHGFVRGSYGFPQSDGCVELPPAHAAVVYPLTPLGTLVTVN